MKDEPVLDLIECRHPVVEAYQSAGEFVPNDLHIGGRAQPFVMITGPNMAGKSTVLRQAALITIMAHIGSFVPAAQAEIGVTDRVFCRVGAADNLARGESTFLVEMNEAALILRTATGRSLIVMDELGRGTSTHDGLSIAQAIAEYLVSRVGARTLFATHYHELTAIDHPAIVNRSLRVDHAHGKIVFLRTLVEGAAERSYGIDVARMAGLPDPVVERARDLLTRYEEHAAGSPQQLGSPPAVEKSTRDMSLFSAEELVVDQLRAVDPNGLSARAALDLVYRLVDQLQTDQGEQDKRRHRHEPGER